MGKDDERGMKPPVSSGGGCNPLLLRNYCRALQNFLGESANLNSPSVLAPNTGVPFTPLVAGVRLRRAVLGEGCPKAPHDSNQSWGAFVLGHLLHLSSAVIPSGSRSEEVLHVLVDHVQPVIDDSMLPLVSCRCALAMKRKSERHCSESVSSFFTSPQNNLLGSFS
jgi:hypothetical protein